VTPGQIADISGAVMLVGYLPDARDLLTDKGQDADHGRDWLVVLGIQPVISNRSKRKAPHVFDARY
jgi:hypothetical protein